MLFSMLVIFIGGNRFGMRLSLAKIVLVFEFLRYFNFVLFLSILICMLLTNVGRTQTAVHILLDLFIDRYTLLLIPIKRLGSYKIRL